MSALLVVGVWLLRPRLYESVVTFTFDGALVSADAKHPDAGKSPRATAQALLSFALERANDPAPANPATRREFGVDLLRNLQLQLVCRAESADLTESICQRIGIEAVARFPQLLHAATLRKAVRARFQLRDLSWPPFFFGLGWFFVRSPRRMARSTGAAGPGSKAALRESQRWWMPQRVKTAGVAHRSSLIPRRGRSKPPPLGVKTLVGMPGVAAAPPPPMAAPPPPPAAPSAPRAQDAEPPAAGSRVIYHVNSGSWSADSEVVSAPQLDQLRELSESLGKNGHDGCRVLRVASGAASRYAKTQVAAQLAWTLSEGRDTRVLLMEADLDEPALHRVLRLNIPRGFGFSEQLERLGSAEPSHTTTLVRLTDRLHALVESRWGQASLLDSPHFAEVLAQQRREHDVIVLDGPIIDAWTDAKALQNVADGIVLVVASGAALPDELRLAHAHFDNSKILRVVRTGLWAES